MRYFLGVDPGVDTGWCIVEKNKTMDATIVSCGLLDRNGWPSVLYFNRQPSDFYGALIECPEVYRTKFQKGDPNLLIKLAVRVGRYANTFEHVGIATHLVLPKSWKGQIDKTAHHRRLIESLSPANRAVVARCTAKLAASKVHNVLDGVALALWGHNRNRFDPI